MFKILKGKKNKKLWQLVGLIFLVGAIAAGVLLVKQSQDIRENAGVDACANSPGAQCTTYQGCSGVCDGKNGFYTCHDVADDCPSVDNGGGSGGGGEEGSCTDDSQCPNGRHCQNGRCLSASRSTGVFGEKCDSDSPCSGGRKCSTTIGRCMQEIHCRRFSNILKCE